MKKIFYAIFWILVFIAAVYQAGRSEAIRQALGSALSRFAPQQKAVSHLMKAATVSDPVTLYLKNGGVISGQLVQETDRGVLLLWEGGEIFFAENEIERLKKGEFRAEKEGLLFPEALPDAWPHQHPVVLYMKDGRVLDEAIRTVSPERVTLHRELEEGGSIEQDIDRDQIEYLAFQPVRNEASRKIEETLRIQFPEMKWYREGAFVLVTDSYVTWVSEYRKTIRQFATDFYLTFFPLLKDREPQVTHFVVIFDEWGDFIEYTAAEGLPGWLLAGYFSPRTKVLYLFNALGDQFAALLEEAIVGQASDAMREALANVKQGVDSRYHVFLEGQAHDVMKKVSAYHSVLRGMYRGETVGTLRHEMTHGLFHNYGLQTVVLSKVKGVDQEEAKKKRAFLEEENIDRKRDLLMELLRLKKGASPLQVEAANSWLVEGLAAYMEKTPLGTVNKRWLYDFQEAAREGAIFPVEHLTVYKVGSFPGVSHGAREYAYAQSWAFVHFLMDRYPGPFLRYLDRMSRETPKEDEDIEWLLEALGGKDLRELEAEFLAYMGTFPQMEDPFLEQMDTVQSIFQAF